MTPSSQAPKICVVSPARDARSETFIQAHVEKLPAQVELLYGGFFPQYYGDGKSLVERVPRVERGLRRRINHAQEIDLAKLALTRFLREEQVTAILAEYGPTGVALADVARDAGVPLVVHFHGYDASMHDVLAQHAKTYPALFESAAAIVAVSQAMKKRLVSLGAAPGKVHYNPCGVDCELFRAVDAGASPPVFLAVGRFVDKKGPHLTLLAFAKVHAALPEARLRMIGDGPLWGVCQDLARVLGIADAVSFLGPQSHDVVQDEMRRARAFVQHSVEAASGDCEGTPVAVLEAGASALPVVATRHAGIPDVVIEERTGLLVDERDVDGMAAGMLRLAREPALAADLGRNARNRIEANFSMRRSIDNLWSIIDGCRRQPMKAAS